MSDASLRLWPAPAKVNLTLHVLGRRADGWHELDSLVAFAGCCDWLTFEPDEALALAVEGPTAAATGAADDNLVLRAAQALAERIPRLRLGRFHLRKNLPVAAGLGGGSSDAAAALRALAAANGLAEKCSFDTINVFDWLKNNTAVKPHERVIPRFDLIILDPPSFTRNRASVPDALRGYKEIHLRALKLLKPGGTLASFCCSHHVDAGLFLDSLLSAAFDTRHILRRVATYAQSPDHPIIPMIPETEYLKGFAFEKVR